MSEITGVSSAVYMNLRDSGYQILFDLTLIGGLVISLDPVTHTIVVMLNSSTLHSTFRNFTINLFSSLSTNPLPVKIIKKMKNLTMITVKHFELEKNKCKELYFYKL